MRTTPTLKMIPTSHPESDGEVAKSGETGRAMSQDATRTSNLCVFSPFKPLWHVDLIRDSIVQKKALMNHVNVNHLGRRDFVCPHESCKRAFGYKHLLQRHMAKLHANESGVSDEAAETSDEDDQPGVQPERARLPLEIDDITGKNYAVRSRQLLASGNKLRCPHPDLHGLVDDSTAISGGSSACEYVFSRAYDLRRHLHSVHRVEVDRERVDNWVKTARWTKLTSQ